jgi:hypothetical protein
VTGRRKGAFVRGVIKKVGDGTWNEGKGKGEDQKRKKEKKRIRYKPRLYSNAVGTNIITLYRSESAARPPLSNKTKRRR